MSEKSIIYHTGTTCGDEYASEHAPYFVTPITLDLVNEILGWMEKFEGPLKGASGVHLYDSTTYFVQNPGFEDLEEENDIPAVGCAKGGDAMLSTVNYGTILVDRLPTGVADRLDSSEYDGGLNVRSECDRLCVQTDDAYWSCVIKHTDVHVESQAITKKELIQLRDRFLTMEQLSR